MSNEPLKINKCRDDGNYLITIFKNEKGYSCMIQCMGCGFGVGDSEFTTPGEALESVIEDWNDHLPERIETQDE